MGATIQGISFRGAESLISVPGLQLWLDGRRLIELDDNAKVLNWASITDGRIFTAIDAQRPVTADDMWIDFNDLTDSQGYQLRSPSTPSFNFFSNGSPFGYFEILGYKNAASVISSRIFTTRQGSGSGANINLSGSGDRLVYQIVESGSLLSGNQTGVDTLSEEAVHSIGVTRNSLSETNNLKLYIDNVAKLQTTISAATTVDSNSMNIGFINKKRYLTGLKLLYDWTGYTSSQVEAFSARVRTLLAAEKANFAYPT